MASSAIKGRGETDCTPISPIRHYRCRARARIVTVLACLSATATSSIPAHPCLKLNHPAGQKIVSAMGARDRGLFRDSTEPGGKLPSVLEQASVTGGRDGGRRGERSDANDRDCALRVVVVLHLRGNLGVAPGDLPVKLRSKCVSSLPLDFVFSADNSVNTVRLRFAFI